MLTQFTAAGIDSDVVVDVATTINRVELRMEDVEVLECMVRDGGKVSGGKKRTGKEIQ